METSSIKSPRKMPKARIKFAKKFLSIFLCFSMVVAVFGNMTTARAINVGTNPTPKIDIAVNVPADYPGTFLDFKQELTQKLIDQGLDPSDFRITNTAVSIDTSSMDGWIVYDHYYNNASYNSLVPEDQRALQPYRAADNSHASNGGANILSYINKTTNKFTNTACVAFNRHIGIYQSESGASNMAFAGYGTQALSDYMIYPAPNSTTRTFSFNIDASVIDTHTLSAFGFWMNAAVENGKTSGYLLYFDAGSAAGGTASISIRKVNDVDANSQTPGFAGTTVAGSAKSFSLGPQKKIRLTVELKKDSVTIQQQAYDASGNLSDVQTVLRDFPIEQFKDHNLNGLGPWVGYSSHGCSGFSAIVYTDLEMSYEASAFDALKYVQYYEGAEYKYFINLAGDSGNPGIPKEHTEDGNNKDYSDGINRMNENEIFYVSNVQDGLVVTDSEYEKNEDGSLKLDELGNPILAKDEDGNVIHQGLGSSNGCIASSDDYASQMAEFIGKNFLEQNHFQKAPVSSDLPLANFYVKNATDASQVMTIHLQHLVLNNETIDVNIKDKSKIGLISGKDGYIKDYRYSVYDPNGKTVVNTGWVEGLDKIPNYQFTGSSVSGTYVFELTVRDQLGNESKTFQTYLTAYLDDEEPFIEGKNTARNKATITLTDTGEGIDEDGITFIKDGRGSGVAAYWVTNDVDAQPGEYDWEELDTSIHQHSFDIDINSTDPIVVWVRDECGNIGNKAVFQPIHVKVEDVDGNPIDDYFVFGDKPIIVLPDDEDVPPSEDDDEYWSGWETPEKDPVTPGTTPPTNDDNEIVIRPSYSKDQAALVYLPNSGLIDGKDASKTIYVTSNASILQKIGDQNVIPTRKGYTFTGWKLLKSHRAEDANNLAFISNASNVEVIKEQTAKSSENAGKVEAFVEGDYYYLVAQWEISTYTLKLDANGGSLGNVRSIEHVPYDKLLTTAGADISNDDGLQAIPTTGRANPTKPGYIFQGWSTSKNAMDNVDNTFMLANGISGITLTPDVKMPASDMTIYAVWKTDTNKFVVHFNSNGGNTIKDQAYVISAATVYDQFSEPQRAGYTFDGWYREEDLADITTEVNGVLIFKDGVTKPTVYSGGETIAPKSEHTFVAMWTPNSKTKYTVNYYVNSGNKDANGNFIYTKVSSATKSYMGPTESHVAVKDADKTSTITSNGVKYWYNDKNANNVQNGVVTGNPQLELKLYYDRYFDISITANGNGTVGGSAKGLLEWSDSTVTWAAKEGSYVSRIIMDGVIRDDLLGLNSFTFKELHKNHEVVVEFKDKPSKPTTPPIPDDVTKYYQIQTSIEGSPDGKCTITPTKRIEKGQDAKVEWTLASGYELVEVIVDGKAHTPSGNTVTFNGVGADHNVVVKVKKLPTNGGGYTEGQYTVTVNRYGGDDSCTVSKSAIVNLGDSVETTWSAGGDYKVYKVVVNGKEVKANGKYNFNNIKKNNVIDIYFAKDDSEEMPEYDEKDYNKILTQIIGGPGEITSGAVIESGSNYEVNWEIAPNAPTDPDDPNYVAYKVDKVEVNGEVVDLEDNKLNFDDITEDTDVKVYVSPDLYDVTILTYGDGTASSSKTMYKNQNYVDIAANPNTGNAIVKIVVDGEEVEVEADQQTAMFAAFALSAETSEPSSEVTSDNATSSNYSAQINKINQDHIIEVYFAKVLTDDSGDPIIDPDTGKPETDPLPETLYSVSARIEGANGTIEGEGIVEADGSKTVTWNIGTDYKITKVTVNGEEVEVVDNKIVLENINEDKQIVVYAEKNTPNDTVVDEGDFKVKEYTITTVLRGGAGTITNGAKVLEGRDYQVDWSVLNAGDKIKEIWVDGDSRPDLFGLTRSANTDTGGTYLFENIQADHEIVVVLGKKLDTNIDIDGDGIPDLNIDTDGDGLPDVNVDTDGDNRPDVNIDTDHTGEWKPSKDGGNSDGIWMPDTNVDRGDGKGPVGTNPKEPIDEDGDGVDDRWKPDTNVYPKGESEQGYDTYVDPNINIDTDGDGEPDINIDTDGDGEPDVNIDTDDDGKPDINIDTDKDGKPDVNVDVNGDGKPDINIDTDKDGKPDINIDKDGDKKPDVNVDTDGDGKPDINIDKDGDGKPDINIDTDDDGKPDVNVDTDDDGKPDINIDTDKDGKPDVNIDVDEDGKPDVNVDTDKDGKPDINIDSDKDGKPDLNIDTDGDGKPDLNIDTNGDGKADLNIDTDGDGKPDLNIDTNGDGIPDKNIDADGDGKPDVNVDTSDDFNMMMYVWTMLVAGVLSILLNKKRKLLASK